MNFHIKLERKKYYLLSISIYFSYAFKLTLFSAQLHEERIKNKIMRLSKVVFFLIKIKIYINNKK